MENNVNNYKIRILAIGRKSFIESLSKNFLVKLANCYNLETITNKKQAVQRLNHNSYDLLLLQDGFYKNNTLKLSKMAYAMSRPTIIICNSIFKAIYYSFFWKHFSTFTRRFKTSKKLIFFSTNNSKYFKLIKYLALSHTQYFDTINSEISSNVKI